MTLAVTGFKQTSQVDVTTIVSDLPDDVVAGELLVVVLNCYGNTGTVTTTTPAGWTKAIEDNANSHATLTVFVKTSEGNETTFSSDTNRTVVTITHAYRVAGWDDFQLSSIASQSSSGSVNLITVPPIEPPWSGGGLYFWFSTAGRTTAAVTAMPSGYTNQSGQSGQNGSGHGSTIASGYKESSANDDAAGDVVWSTFRSMFAVSMAIKGISAEPGISLEGVFAPDQTITVIPQNNPQMTDSVRVTDSGNNSMLLPLDYDEGEDEYTFVLPSLPSAGNSAQGLLFGQVTVSLEDAD